MKQRVVKSADNQSGWVDDPAESAVPKPGPQAVTLSQPPQQLGKAEQLAAARENLIELFEPGVRIYLTTPSI
jgi:hypothetical protein